MIIQKINFSQFCDSFSDTYNNNFSYDGKRALFDYLEDSDEDVELDPVALCCDYTEYKDLKDLQNAYPEINTMEELQDKTQVFIFDNGFIIADF